MHVQELPEVFASIDPQGAKGHVLAAVSGTDEARLAVLEASIPRKATVSRDAGDKVNVFFQGEPVFEEIPGTSVQRAVNSSNDIFKVGEGVLPLRQRGLVCDDEHGRALGSWRIQYRPRFTRFRRPHRRITVTDTCTSTRATTNYVSTGYTSGYFGVSVAFGVAMYGSGWYYPPYYGYYPHYGYPHYPYYYPIPV